MGWIVALVVQGGVGMSQNKDILDVSSSHPDEELKGHAASESRLYDADLIDPPDDGDTLLV